MRVTEGGRDEGRVFVGSPTRQGVEGLPPTHTRAPAQAQAGSKAPPPPRYPGKAG